MKSLTLCLTLALGLGFFSDSAYGYIDPGSGHLIWQAILASFFGIAFVTRRIFSFRFSRKKD